MADEVFRGYDDMKVLSDKCTYSMNIKSTHCAVKWSLPEFHFYIQCWIKITDALMCMLYFTVIV